MYSLHLSGSTWIFFSTRKRWENIVMILAAQSFRCIPHLIEIIPWCDSSAPNFNPFFVFSRCWIGTLVWGPFQSWDYSRWCTPAVGRSKTCGSCLEYASGECFYSSWLHHPNWDTKFIWSSQSAFGWTGLESLVQARPDLQYPSCQHIFLSHMQGRKWEHQECGSDWDICEAAGTWTQRDHLSGMYLIH